MDRIKNIKKRRFFLRTRLLFERKKDRIPNFFTLSNALFGFTSIIFTCQDDFLPAAYFILFGALFDALDGRVARLLGTTSELGSQLDSLCDAISFCLAPSLLIYQWELHRAGFFGFLACVAFLLTGLTRLARFNITKQDQTIYFLGVPTTIAGCFLASIVLSIGDAITSSLFVISLLILIALLSWLMISSIHFPSFKYIKKWHGIAFGLVALSSIIALGLIKVLFGLFIIYFVFSLQRALSRYLVARRQKKHKRNLLLI